MNDRLAQGAELRLLHGFNRPAFAIDLGTVFVAALSLATLTAATLP